MLSQLRLLDKRGIVQRKKRGTQTQPQIGASIQASSACGLEFHRGGYGMLHLSESREAYAAKQLFTLGGNGH
jgi:hypothetical protein